MKKNTIIEIYKKLYLIRAVEEKIASKYNEGKMRCPVHLSVGQEAVPAALSQIIDKNDFAVSTHRGHAHYLAKGGNLNRMIAEIYGKKTGCSKGRGGSMHLLDLDVNFMGTSAIVGNSIPVGVGLGLSINLNNSDRLSCIFLGEGAVEEGVFYESINFTALKNLPVLFICENNLYSVYSNLSVRQPKNRKIFEMVQSMGINSSSCDGNDPLACYDLLNKKVKSIRNNKGPQFIEFYTYRWLEHCGPNYDNDLGYRKEDEFLAWKKKDPLLLIESIINNAPDVNNIKKIIDIKVEEAFKFAEDSPFPDSTDAFDGVYAE